MIDWEKSLSHSDSTLRETLAVIDRSGIQFAMMVDDDRRILGTLSDGDVRRWLINGGSIDDNAILASNKNPKLGKKSDERCKLIDQMQEHGIRHLPIVDDNNIVLGLAQINDALLFPEREETVIIMAGGLGSRMGDLTSQTPKPMLPIGGRPLLENIIGEFKKQGFRNFCITVNYLASQIMDHFGDGSKYDIQIDYVQETKRLGTAGALSLIKSRPTQPFILTNGDLLIRENFAKQLDAHIADQADISVSVRDYEMQVPFGVVDERDGSPLQIVEKPTHVFKVNAGVYCISPAVLSLVPHNTFFDMPELFNKCVQNKLKAKLRNMEGYWIDIGRSADYERAQHDFHKFLDD